MITYETTPLPKKLILAQNAIASLDAKQLKYQAVTHFALVQNVKLQLRN